MTASRRNILLVGRPGVGKTTVIQRLAERLVKPVLAGFTTEEIRSGGARQGFRAVTLAGESSILAHVGVESAARVGRYGVDVTGFEELVLHELDRPCDLMLIDEIGKMECFSSRFVAATEALLDSDTPVIATVASRGSGLIARVKSRGDVELVEVTRRNRDELPQDLAARLTAHSM
jgi:nucleoside-triphosphatase